jgi:hypothetical protein
MTRLSVIRTKLEGTQFEHSDSDLESPTLQALPNDLAWKIRNSTGYSNSILHRQLIPSSRLNTVFRYNRKLPKLHIPRPPSRKIDIE